jgi:hypothetical protein
MPLVHRLQNTRRRARIAHRGSAGISDGSSRAPRGDVGTAAASDRPTSRRSGFDAAFGRPASLRTMNTDPNDYDLVLVGTPVWNASVSTPVRTYLSANRDRIRRVAFFCTYGGTGSGRALRQMEEACAQAPVLTMALRSEEVRRGAIAAKVRTFVSALKTTPKIDTPVVKPQTVLA